MSEKKNKKQRRFQQHTNPVPEAEFTVESNVSAVSVTSELLAASFFTQQYYFQQPTSCQNRQKNSHEAIR
jgi:hypothetical protein